MKFSLEKKTINSDVFAMKSHVATWLNFQINDEFNIGKMLKIVIGSEKSIFEINNGKIVRTTP